MEKLLSTSGQYPHSASLTIIEGDVARLAPGPGGPPPFVAAPLPERYGMALFEFLVVDPEFVFISWELSPQQLEAAHAAIGDSAWAGRKLMLSFRASEVEGGQAVERELYGDTGRWFVRLGLPGLHVTAELGYVFTGGRHRLATAGPLLLPRTLAVDGEYIELQVDYGTAEDGSLVLDSAEASAPAIDSTELASVPWLTSIAGSSAELAVSPVIRGIDVPAAPFDATGPGSSPSSSWPGSSNWSGK